MNASSTSLGRLLDRIDCPADVRRLPEHKLQPLADEVRTELMFWESLPAIRYCNARLDEP